MSYATDHIASTLKMAREGKGLSQRVLSSKAGVPQGHISKIENGTVDLRLSSLVALARALDLELTLIPRKMTPVVRSIVSNSARSTGASDQNSRQILKELKRLQDRIANASQSHPAITELVQLQRQIRELAPFQGAIPLQSLRDASKAMKAFNNDSRRLDAIREVLTQLKDLRHALAHSSVHVMPEETVRSAYDLDEDDNG